MTMTSIRKSAAAVVLCSLLGGSAVAQDRPVYLDASAPSSVASTMRSGA